MVEEGLPTCKSCGRPIVWAVTLAGKRIPLNPRRDVVYDLDEDILGNPPTAIARGQFHLSHFLTCPGANEFSGRNR